MAGTGTCKMASGKDARTYERLVSFVCPHCQQATQGIPNPIAGRAREGCRPMPELYAQALGNLRLMREPYQEARRSVSHLLQLCLPAMRRLARRASEGSLAGALQAGWHRDDRQDG